MPEMIRIADLMETSGVKFGTSGARGLVSAMTDRVCYAYTRAFLEYLKEAGLSEVGDGVVLGGDLRPSSPRILVACARAVEDAGLLPINGGELPTPAIAWHAQLTGSPAVMVTGSHIPDDRNGIKYYRADGEILKPDEAAIKAQQVELADGLFDADGALTEPGALNACDLAVRDSYLRRYTDFFPTGLFTGKRVLVYQHSSVARDLLVELFEALGAEVVRKNHSDTFIPVDTEAIRGEDEALARQWAATEPFDLIVSTDGDGDRPLLGDENGEWLRGDVLGILIARYLRANAVVTPVSSNTALEKSGWFERITRTRIGSPFVIEAMRELDGEGRQVVGYEANGGFLIQNEIALSGRKLGPLATRDAVLPALALLALAVERDCAVSALLADLPPRFTASDRLKEFPREISLARLAKLQSGDSRADLAAASAMLDGLAGVVEIDQTDGVRMTLANAEVVHFRPSGNAPELRCYTEADSAERALKLNRQCLAILETWR